MARRKITPKTETPPSPAPHPGAPSTGTSSKIVIATTPEASYARHSRRLKKERVKTDAGTVVVDRTLPSDIHELAFISRTGITFAQAEGIREEVSKRMLRWIEHTFGPEVKTVTLEAGDETLIEADALKTYEAEKSKLYLQLLGEANYRGRPLWFIRAGMTADEESKMPKVKKAKSKVQQKPTTAAVRHTKDVETKHGTFRDGTVLLEIYRAFDLANGATPQEILERLAAKFPERNNPQGLKEMMVTVRTQINRMPKERKFELGRDDKGRYGIHIKGHSSVRVLSPEAQLKLEARQAAKAAKDGAVKSKKLEKKAGEVKKKAAKSPGDKALAKKAAELEKAAKAEAAKAEDAKKTTTELAAELKDMGIKATPV